MRWLVGTVVVTALTVAPGVARDAPRDPAYQRAYEAFEFLTPENRVFVQVMLTAAGYWVNVPTQRFGVKLYEAIRKAQMDGGLAPTGMIDTASLKVLGNRFDAVWPRWGMKDIVHPSRKTRIYVPTALGLHIEKNNENEIIIKDSNGRFLMEYFYLPSADLDAVWKSAQEVYKPSEISYKVRRDDFVVVYGQEGEKYHYERFHRDPQSPGGTGVLGYSLNWMARDTDLMGDRLATIISGRFAGEMSGQPTWKANIVFLPEKRSPAQTATAPTPPQTPAPAAVTPPAPAGPAPQATPKEPRASSGSGYYVSTDGHVLTNQHVVNGCTEVTVKSSDGPIPGRILAQDRKNDLALIKIARNPANVATFRPSVRLGESVAAYGYPLTGYLTQNGNFTIGNVSALAGLDDDSRELQISTPIQPGNSGGPLLDERGFVVGTIVAKLNALKLATSEVRDIPQNVNFAIKSSVALGFMEGNGVNVQLTTTSTAAASPVLTAPDLADKARAIAVNVQCMRE